MSKQHRTLQSLFQDKIRYPPGVWHEPGPKITQRRAAMSGQVQAENTKLLCQEFAQLDELIAVAGPAMSTNQRDGTRTR